MYDSVANNFPFVRFHDTKTYEEILSDCEINQSIRGLLADININIYGGIYKTYDYLFKSAYWICGMFTHPAYMMAALDTIKEMYVAVEKYAFHNDPCLSFHQINDTDSCLIRSIVYLILARMSGQIEGTAQIRDLLECDLYSNSSLAPYLKKFNHKNRKKYNFNFGIEPDLPSHWEAIDVCLILYDYDLYSGCQSPMEKGIIQFVNCWESYEDRKAMIEKVRTFLISDDWLKPYEEAGEKEKHIDLYNSIADRALMLLENEYIEAKGKDPIENTEVKGFYNPFFAPTINIQHVDTLNNYHGECIVATVEKSESIQSIKEETKDNKSEINHSPEYIIRYVMKLHPVYVSSMWEEHYSSLWEAVLQLPEVKTSIYNKGRQRNTMFNRNLVGNILCLMVDKKVLCENNATKITIALENNGSASIRAQLGTMPAKAIKESVIRTIDNFFS